ncbi:MAG: hypothetical protein ACK50G_02225 [bacterium]|jgi:hypothetical protein
MVSTQMLLVTCLVSLLIGGALGAVLGAAVMHGGRARAEAPEG